MDEQKWQNVLQYNIFIKNKIKNAQLFVVLERNKLDKTKKKVMLMLKLTCMTMNHSYQPLWNTV